MLLNPGERASDPYIDELAGYIYGVIRGFRLMYTQFPGVIHWNDMPETERLKWRALISYRLLRPFADAVTSEPCIEAMDWRSGEARHTAYELLANMCRILQMGMMQPSHRCCNKHAALSVGTMFNCGLPADHKGVCVPAGAIPIPEAKPQYQPGDDE